MVYITIMKDKYIAYLENAKTRHQPYKNVRKTPGLGEAIYDMPEWIHYLCVFNISMQDEPYKKPKPQPYKKVGAWQLLKQMKNEV